MKRLIPLVFLALPMALFAQGFRDQETAMLKKFGLNDSQVSQVFDIQTKTRATLRQDAVQIRLLRAQMDKALLPVNPNMQDVTSDIAQISQARADMMKAFVTAGVQLRQIIGEDNFPTYTRFIRQGAAPWHRRVLMMRPGVPGGFRGARGSDDGPVMGPGSRDNSPMMGDAFGTDDLDQ